MSAIIPFPEQYVVPDNPPVATLEVRKAFDSLSHEEKLYAHWMSQASWLGARICLHQTSLESPHLFDLFQSLFSPFIVNSSSPATNDWQQSFSAAVLGEEITEQDIKHFLQYAATFIANMGNYLSFGDTKFIPRLPATKFSTIVTRGSAQHDDGARARVLEIYNLVKDKIYSLEQHEKHIDKPDSGHGISTYYSAGIPEADVELVSAFMVEQKISPHCNSFPVLTEVRYNTRLFLLGDGVLQLRLAAATPRPGGTHQYKGRTIEIVYGDYGNILTSVVEALKKAKPYAVGEHQCAMIDAYIKHFDLGHIDDHKEAQRQWVRDVGPVVETNIGFIESYRDPYGIRGEFEGFVAVVNKETSKKFAALVNGAAPFLKTLPWPASFEKDEFKRPDFTSLEVLTFANSGIPAGINIPNYDDIRQDFGFKNVSLGNVISAAVSTDKVTFLKDEDQRLFLELKVPSFEVQVAGHELLGHGSGKVFVETDGKLNFDPELINPITNQKVSTWYKSGQTYDSQFGVISSALEECRAECVGIYLSTNPEMLKIFGHHDTKEQEDIMYVNWLNMVRAGVVGLEMYSPENSTWRQAHMRARFAILRVLLAAGQGLVTLDIGSDDATISIARDKIRTIGVPAIADFLAKIQIYKSTADVAGATKMFGDATAVPSEYLRLRELVLAKKKPRPAFVQAHTEIDREGKVQFVEFPPTHAGLIASHVTRFNGYQS